MNAVVILTIKTHCLGFSAVLHEAQRLVKRNRWLIGHVHLQVHTMHAATKGVLKRCVHDLSAESSATVPRGREYAPHHHLVMRRRKQACTAHGGCCSKFTLHKTAKHSVGEG